MHDVHCQIEGDAARDLLDVFVQRWLAHPEHNQFDKPFDKGGKGPLLGLADLAQDSAAKSLGNQYVGIARTFNFVGNRMKCIKEQSIRTTMINAIRAATKFIYFEDQYLWNLDAAKELGKALSSIKHLIILVSHSEQVESALFPQSAHARFLGTLLGAAKTQDREKVRVFYRIAPGTNQLGRGSYIHSKTWIFDDELAVIGSANCNQRGWSSDSEVIAAIFDEPGSKGNLPFAQTLRIELWKKHLGEDKENTLKDWEKGAALWPMRTSQLDPKCNVRFYDLATEKGRFVSSLFDTKIDPRAESLGIPLCGEACGVAG